MNGQNPKLNFRYKCQINEINYNIQLFNIQQEKIKIMITTKNSYSDDYVEYSNIYSLIQFQEITKYFLLFETIEEIFNDLCHIIHEKNFTLSHNGNTMTLSLKILINQKEKDVIFILDKNKTIDLSSQKDNLNFYNNNYDYNYNNTISSKNSAKNKYKQLSLEKSKRNVDISNINDLNNLLNDFKYRLNILETRQNIPDSNNNYNNFNTYDNNDNLSIGLENILMRLNKLESENNQKDKKIEILEKKLKYYESPYNNKYYTNNDKDDIYFNSTPTYPNNYSQRNHIYSEHYYNNNYNYRFQAQRQSSLTYKKNANFNKYNNNEIYISDNSNRKNYNKYKLKQSKSEIFNKDNNNSYKENMSLYSKDTKNNNLKNNSFNSKKISFKENNQSFPEKNTFRSNKMNNSIGNEVNSNYLNNSNLNSTLSNYSSGSSKNFRGCVDCKEKLKIPIVPRENLKKYINSRIIFTKNELKLLKMKLSNGNKKIHVFFDLLYRASIDGDYEEIISENIINKEKTLTLFYTYEGSRFGAYTHFEKAKSFLKGRYYKEVPGTSFIVSLNNLKFFDIEYNKTSKEGFEDYLCFGRTYYLNENGSNWLICTPRTRFLKKRCIIGVQQGQYFDYDPEILVGKKHEYHIKDVEIFEVVFEKENDEDKKH